MIGEVLIERKRLEKRYDELGQSISADYGIGVPILVSVLKGSVFFMAELAKRLTMPCEFDFMGISRYAGKAKADGVVRITRDIDLDVTGRHVLLVEDIVDTGLTASYLRKIIMARRPESFQICALLNRRARRIADVEIKYWGFDLADVFVVGVGLDYRGLYRNLTDIRSFKVPET